MNRYPSYKPSGVKWLGEIPSHWRLVKSKYLWKESFATSENGNEELLSVSQYDGITPAKGDSRSESLKGYKIVSENDLVINIMLAWMGGLGVSNYNGIVSPAYCIYKLNDDSNPKFLHYLYKTPLYLAEFARHSTGVIPSRWRMYTDDFGQVLSLIPPREEQDAIVSYLDERTAKIDAAIAQQQKMIDLLNERKQIIINRAVTKGLNPNAKMKDSGVEWIGEVPCHWECRKLKSICANTQYSIKTGPFGSQLKGDDIQEFGDVPIYNQRVVIDNDCYLFNSYVSKAKADALKSFVVKSKDLLITTRGTIGKSTIVPNDALEGILHPCIIAIRLNFDLCWNEYLQFFFQSIAFNTDMTLKSNATTIEVIYSYNLKECFVPIPPIDEQKHIVEYLNEELSKINQTIAATTNQISLLQERKQIIINEVVTGKVKVV